MVLDEPTSGIMTPEKPKDALASEGVSKHLSLAPGLAYRRHSVNIR